VSLVEQELLTLPEHLSAPPIFSGDHAAQSLDFCVVLCKSLFVLLFILTIVLSILLRFRASDYFLTPFGIFKPFFHNNMKRGFFYEALGRLRTITMLLRHVYNLE